MGRALPRSRSEGDRIVTPRRRQGSGRAAIDHIAAGLTNALSTLSKVTVSQAAIAEAARDDAERTAEILGRLDDDLLAAVEMAASLVAGLARAERTTRRYAAQDAAEGKSP